MFLEKIWWSWLNIKGGKLNIASTEVVLKEKKGKRYRASISQDLRSYTIYKVIVRYATRFHTLQIYELYERNLGWVKARWKNQPTIITSHAILDARILEAA